MKTKTISQSAKLFLKYTYSGNGKYYLIERGSQSYKNTTFANFWNKNGDCLEIIDRGNDAPRGGKTGDFVIVRFLPCFFDKYGAFMEKEKAMMQATEARKNKLLQEIEAIGNQKELLQNYFQNAPDFKRKIVERMQNYSSRQWRNWVKMKVAAKLTNGRFDLLTLSPSDIRNIAIS